MGLESTVFAILTAGCFVAWIFFLLFAQVTVRKLEKNTVTKQALGFEFVSGWRILNVAEALVLPAGYFRLTRRSPLSFLNADAELLRQHTTWLDRAFAHLLFWPFVTSGAGLIVAVILGFSGFFDWYESL